LPGAQAGSVAGLCFGREYRIAAKLPIRADGGWMLEWVSPPVVYRSFEDATRAAHPEWPE
jgi:hypothetical protein